MAKKGSSTAKKGRYAAYKSSFKWKANRIAMLQKHLKTNPDDAIAAQALKKAETATKPRRAGYHKTRVVKDGVVVRSSDRLYREIKRQVKGALNASVYEQKKDAAKLAELRKAGKL